MSPDNPYLDPKKSIVAAVDELFAHELITPTGGNVSIRCPDSDHILITASQIFKGDLGPQHILEVDAKGKQVEGQEGLFSPAPGAGSPAGLGAGSSPPSRIRPSVETGMHLAIYTARPDVGAVVHTHAPLATIWGLFDEPVTPLTIDCIRFTEMRTVPFAAPGSRELATTASEALVRGPAALLRNHGLITVGKDLREAVDNALALEESLKITFMAKIAASCDLAGKEAATIPTRAAEFLKKVMIG